MSFLMMMLFLATSIHAYSVIDLGNLEVEGEVRRPMINLYNNVVDQKIRFEMFAGELSFNVDLLEVKTNISSEGLQKFRLLENEFSEVN